MVDWKDRKWVAVLRRLCGINVGSGEGSPLCCRATKGCKLHTGISDPAYDVHILVCIIKNGLKEICQCMVTTKKCPPPLAILVDVASQLDKIDCGFATYQSGYASVSDYAILVADLKTLHCRLKDYFERNLDLVNERIVLVSCILACFMSIEKHILIALTNAAVACTPPPANQCPLPPAPCKSSRMVIKTNTSKTCAKPCASTCPKPCASTCPKPCASTFPKPATCAKPCAGPCEKPCKEVSSPCEKNCSKPAVSCDSPSKKNVKTSRPPTPCDKITTCPKTVRYNCKDAGCQAKSTEHANKNCEVTRMVIEYWKCEGDDCSPANFEPGVKDRIELENGFVETERRDRPGLITYTFRAVVCGRGGLACLASKASDPTLKDQLQKMMDTASYWYRSAALLYDQIKPCP